MNNILVPLESVSFNVIRLSILSSVKMELFKCLMAFEKVIVILELTLIFVELLDGLNVKVGALSDVVAVKVAEEALIVLSDVSSTVVPIAT